MVPLSEPKDISFCSDLDNSTQFYMEMLPSNFDKKKKYDLVIGLHGHGSDRKQFALDKRDEARAYRDFAARHEMIAITPDYRAETSWMGSKAEADVLQIIKELKNKYKVKRIFLAGGSMGGTSALTFTALYPELISGVTSFNGHANHLEFENFQDAIATSFGGSKKEIPGEYKKRSAEYWPERFTMPVAISTGGKDESVPPDSCMRFSSIIKKHNSSVLFIHRPDTGHETDYNDCTAALEFMLKPITRY